ncbi:MAG: DUF2946 family protein [Bradyrhizobium sp.]
MAMEHWIGRHMPKSKAPAIRRALLMFIAFAYLFVGFAHTFAHSAEYLDAAFAPSQASVSLAEDSDDDESKKSSVAGEHCQVCAPAMMPVLVADAVPALRPMRLGFSIPRLLRESQLRLDTPPPRQLI